MTVDNHNIKKDTIDVMRYKLLITSILEPCMGEYPAVPK
jgi:hypothetical protein